jgi:hypothetical protein
MAISVMLIPIRAKAGDRASITQAIPRDQTAESRAIKRYSHFTFAAFLPV